MTVLQTEKTASLKEIQQSSGASVNRKYTILHLAHQKFSAADSFFFGDATGKTRTTIAPLIVETFSKLEKIKPQETEIEDPADIFNGDIRSVVSSLKKEGLSKDELAETYAAKVVERFAEISELKDREISLTDEVNFTLLKNPEKLRKIMEETKRWGVFSVDNFYQKFPHYLAQVRDIKSIDTLQLFRLKVEKDLRNTPEDRLVLERIESVIQDKIKKAEESRRSELNNRESHSKKERSRQYYRALERGLNYLRYCYPKEDVGKLAVLAEVAVKQIARTRDTLSQVTDLFASSHQLAEIFWPVRLGRKIIDTESTGLSEKSIERYTKSVLDQRLRTESAAFWFEKKTKLLPNYELHPNLVLIRSIESLLEAHKKLYGQKAKHDVKIMLLVNDNTTLKFSLPYDSDYAAIVNALNRARAEKPDLSIDKKYLIKKDAYKTTRKSQSYYELYEHKEKKKIKILKKEVSLPFEKKVEGDYIVRLTTHSRRSTINKNSPYSLFSVDSHKALVDIDLNSGSGMEISMKLAHQKFDGRPAKPFFKNFYQGLETRHANDLKRQITAPHFNFLTNVGEIEQTNKVIIEDPLFEANASTSYDQEYQKIIFKDRDGKHTISPNVIRSAVLSLANDASDAHVLFAAKTNPHTEGPYDNIQPVIVSLHPIKKIYKAFKEASEKGLEYQLSKEEAWEVSQWVKNTNEAVEFGKMGLSTPAVLAAPTGHAEKFIYEISKMLYKAVTLLKESSGMFSPLPDLAIKDQFDDIVFYTATGDTYGRKSDLLHPVANTGTIGYSQSSVERKGRTVDQIYYSIRKTPQQSQVAFANFVKKDLLVNDRQKVKKERKALVAVNQLIVDWEDLILGKLSPEDYDQKLRQVFERLCRDDVCGYKNLELIGITDHKALQARLNIVFTEDSRTTIDPKRLAKERDIFYDFMAQASQRFS